MPPTNQPNNPQLPSGESTLPEYFKNCWTMFYRHGVNAQINKSFYFKGPMHQAIERAQKHCQVMGYKYIFLRPAFPDIDYEEAVQMGLIDPRTGLRKEQPKEA